MTTMENTDRANTEVCVDGDGMDVIVTVDDVLKAGHCVVPGLRDWCKQHSLDLRTFVKVGYPARVLMKTDALAIRVIELKRLRDGR